MSPKVQNGPTYLLEFNNTATLYNWAWCIQCKFRRSYKGKYVIPYENSVTEFVRRIAYFVDTELPRTFIDIW